MTTSIGAVWNANRDKLIGEKNIKIASFDRKNLMFRIFEASQNIEGLPEDFDNPETMAEVEAVNKYVLTLQDLFNEGVSITEDMYVGEQVEKAYKDSLEGKGETISDHEKMVETGHSNGDF